MFLIYSNSIPNKIYDINTNISDFSVPQQDFDEAFQPISAFFSEVQGLSASCQYPVAVRDLFPYWLRVENDGNSVLISLTESYYQWLACNCSDIADISFFNLEKLLDLETVPTELLTNLANTYVNSLPPAYIDDGTITSNNLKKLIENIKINLYSKKGTAASVKYFISTAFGIDVKEISVSYPKRYMFKLNGGNYDWMRDNLGTTGQYSTNLNSFYPQLTGNRLNVSVLRDGDLWQEYSYVVNDTGLTLTTDLYTNIVKPVVHATGTKYFVNTRPDIFNNSYDSLSFITVYEIPKIQNYTGYTLGSTQTLPYTDGCVSGLTSATYVFPSWDVEISAYPGISFGRININDFLTLLPLPGYTFPNELLTCDS